MPCGSCSLPSFADKLRHIERSFSRDLPKQVADRGQRVSPFEGDGLEQKLFVSESHFKCLVEVKSPFF